MSRTKDRDREATPDLDAALLALVPLFSESTRLPAAADLLERARLREREIAAERLARWHSRVRNLVLGLGATAAAAAAYVSSPQWAGWLLEPLLASPALPGPADAAVLAGAVLAGSGAILWVSQRLAEE